jgi:CD2 antigen cytoplasmic tail-binding protein 2
MSTKKKVQFSDKKKFSKYAREESESGSGGEQDYSDEDAERKKVKHSLDSDEEDNTEKYEILNKDTLDGRFDLFTFNLIVSLHLHFLVLLFNEDIGQEDKTAEFEGDIKLTPFNMKDELDEGDFDKEGYYHWKKDVIYI